jgi:hypothetical protein
MLPGVQDRTIDNGLALALRPLIHPPRPITKELVKIVYWNFVVAWLEIQSPLFRRYLALGKKTSGNKAYIALVVVSSLLWIYWFDLFFRVTLLMREQVNRNS